MEFETFSSVNAKTRRRAPLVINSSMWAFTFSTPASANTTGVVSEGIAPRPASTSTATLFAGANVSATREDPSREIVDHRVQVGASPIEQADDGGVDVPHVVGASRSQANLRFGRMHAEPRPSPAELPHQVVPGGRGAHTLPSRCARTASVPIGTCGYSGAVTMSLIAKTSDGVSRWGNLCGQDD